MKSLEDVYQTLCSALCTHKRLNKMFFTHSVVLTCEPAFVCKTRISIQEKKRGGNCKGAKIHSGGDSSADDPSLPCSNSIAILHSSTYRTHDIPRMQSWTSRHSVRLSLMEAAQWLTNIWPALWNLGLHCSFTVHKAKNTDKKAF